MTEKATYYSPVNNSNSEIVLSLEQQRYGRNKSTIINKTYIESGAFRRKFDKITSNANLARLLYNKAKEILYHRSGTEYEDMYWFNSDDSSILTFTLDEKETERVIYTPGILKAIENCSNIIALHNHPHSMPPSLEDINSAYAHGYKYGIVVCHDGRIFVYSSMIEISERLYDFYYSEQYDNGCSEYDSQLGALMELKRNGDIIVEEV